MCPGTENYRLSLLSFYTSPFAFRNSHLSSFFLNYKRPWFFTLYWHFDIYTQPERSKYWKLTWKQDRDTQDIVGDFKKSETSLSIVIHRMIYVCQDQKGFDICRKQNFYVMGIRMPSELWYRLWYKTATGSSYNW